MKIGIDAHTIGYRVSGNKTYIENLIKNIADMDRENRYTLYFTNREIVGNNDYSFSNFEKELIFPSSPWLRMSFGFPWKLLQNPVDLLHVQYFAPLCCPCDFVVTIHDISFELFPEFYTKVGKMWRSVLIPFTARRAKKILTVSESSKRDLIDYYGIPEEKIVITYDAVDPDIFRQIQDREELNRLRNRYSLPESFIFSVGRLEPRKNMVRLIRAYASLRKEQKIKHKLVIGGKKDFLYSEIFKAVESLGLEKDVIFTGFIPSEDLALFHNAADLFVYPSIFEGFGLGALEAMSCGTPVVASNTSSIPEVIGDAGLLFDPCDVEEIAKAIYEVISDEELKIRLGRKGLERAKLFSWEETARKTLKVYEEVFSQKKKIVS